MFKQTNNRTEPDSRETLDLEPAFCHEWNDKEYLRIAVLPEDARGPEGTLSLQVVHFNKKYEVTAAQACLTLEEIDLVISALLEAKKRMQAL
jgi:hypothetical protein